MQKKIVKAGLTMSCVEKKNAVVPLRQVFITFNVYLSGHVSVYGPSS